MRPLPNIIWTPFDTNPSPLHEILYVYMIWNLFLSLFGNAFYDALYIYCLVHLYVQFELLKELLKNLSTGIMEDASDLDRFQSQYFQKKVMDRLKLGDPGYQQAIGQELGVSQATVSRTMDRVVKNIVAQSNEWIKFPTTNHELMEAKRIWQSMFGLNLEKYGSVVLIPQLIMSYLALVVNGFILTLE
ncbi:unnamed protein product [Acanthoscelides obtectus]|uniref:Uncharacterized protein n=1 Tax=Acanthoscelides obtectus TaxID=200917 RepID=A0A9P0KPU3_ACAOB|nr:unnamed protein product [Acanthoscelides obtectus]CAK1646549.1 hypothetical protein AOBTE_LOCUS14700 [Acanthoscelides obtectus]